MKLDMILTEAENSDMKRASATYRGQLAGKEIAKDLKLGKFLGKDEYGEFVVYEGTYYAGALEVQTDSWVTHPETQQDPAEYAGADEDKDVEFVGKFYYSYDRDESEPHYWKFLGDMYVEDAKNTDHEHEGVAATWGEALKELLAGMDSHAENIAQDVYDRNKGWD